MEKLQLRLDQRQTDIVIQALECAENEAGGYGVRDELYRLRSWLRWRRDKFWPPAGGAAAAPAYEWDLCRMCGLTHATANEVCPVCKSDKHCGMRHDA